MKEQHFKTSPTVIQSIEGALPYIIMLYFSIVFLQNVPVLFITQIF